MNNNNNKQAEINPTTMEVPNRTFFDFLRDMAPFNLSYREPRTTNDMWVSWSQEGGEGEGGTAEINPTTMEFPIDYFHVFESLTEQIRDFWSQEEERIFSRAEASEREYRTTDITLSREDLTKHFGKKLDDAAKILNVSRSTMKRALRHHKIDKWPLPKRKKVVCSGNEEIEGTYKGDPSCSDSPPTPATAGISHKTSNSRQEHAVGNMTIKATYGNDTFRFKLPFLSGKADLVEKVKPRVPLNEGSFNIKYQDEENEWISIACDDDLGECIDIWKGKSKIIKMLVEPIINQAP